MPSYGQLVLFTIMLLVFYDVFYAVTATLAGNMAAAVDMVLNQTNTTESSTPLQGTFKVLKTVFSWEGFVLTNAVALAVLLFLSLARDALEAEWRPA